MGKIGDLEGLIFISLLALAVTFMGLGIEALPSSILFLGLVGYISWKIIFR